MSISVKNIKVTIDGNESEKFGILINGTYWRLDNFTLYQSLLTPNSLTFNLHKGPEEDGDEPRFALCSHLIGKAITLALETDNVENLSLNTNNEKTAEINFSGVIFSASGSRNGSQYTIDVEARSWDALLEDNPNCKSFEEMTLDDIVNDVVEDYGDHLSSTVNARFTDNIAYCVQYNETNYQFLQRLAQRYGEWLYNDGERLVFGNLKEGENVTLGYPSKDVPQYSIEMKMQHVEFKHVTSSYNAYDSTEKDGLSEMGRSYNELNDSVFQASMNNFVKPTLQNLHSGGFADNDGRETILNVSTKTQGRGEKATMLTYSGTTYCSKLKLGSTLTIVDNFISDSQSNTKSDVNQDEILITELIHSFSADEVYSNRFAGIPSACDYPPYINSDVYPLAPSCRAMVTDNEDPMNLGRIRVQFDWQSQLDQNMKTPWLRIAQPYAGGGKGFSFIPEIGEEVMVDFEGSNAERPYVKGTLYNGIGDPDPAWVPNSNSSNQIKAIRTRNGHTVEIHDEGNDGYIRIYDNKKENYILTFSTDQKLIKLQSTGNIELYAKRDIVMSAGHDMKITVGNNRTLKVGNNDSTTVGNDQTLNVGNDQSIEIRNDQETTIGGNNTVQIEGDQMIDINGNKDERIVNSNYLSAKDYREEIDNEVVVLATTQQYKSTNSTKIDGGTRIDIKAMITKVN
jgi:Rhs element Vgr protein